MMKKIIALGFMALTAVATGCGGGGGEATVTVTDTQRTGSVTFHWSVDGSFSPGACDAFGVANNRVDIYDVQGAPISTTFVDCRTFSATFDLVPGRYSARLQMTDADNQPRSTSLPISSFTVVAGTNLNIDSDFPRDSFF
jgi:hypothetical protein